MSTAFTGKQHCTRLNGPLSISLCSLRMIYVFLVLGTLAFSSSHPLFLSWTNFVLSLLLPSLFFKRLPPLALSLSVSSRCSLSSHCSPSATDSIFFSCCLVLPLSCVHFLPIYFSQCFSSLCFLLVLLHIDVSSDNSSI